MVDNPYTYQAQAFTVHYPVEFKNFADFQFRNNLRKMLTLNMYETASSPTAVGYGFDAKIKRISESTRKNLLYFPK